MPPRKERRSLGAQVAIPAPPPRPAPRRPVPDLPGTGLPTSEIPDPAVPDSARSERSDSGVTNSVGPKYVARDSVTPNVAKYLQLERKETLLWPRQVESLTLLRRVLNRRKPKGEGERITENTLIRVAVDLLMSRQDVMQGASEDELRRSLGI
jgi:hypothetical protein